MKPYDPCDLCPHDTEYSTMSGTVCENCLAYKQYRQAQKKPYKPPVPVLVMPDSTEAEISV